MKTKLALVVLVCCLLSYWGRADITDTFPIGATSSVEDQQDVGFVKKTWATTRSEAVELKYFSLVFTRTVFFDKQRRIVEQYFYRQTGGGVFDPLRAKRIIVSSIGRGGAWNAVTNEISISPDRIYWNPDSVGNRISSTDRLLRTVEACGPIELYARNVGRSANVLQYTCSYGKGLSRHFTWNFRIESNGAAHLSNGIPANVVFSIKDARSESSGGGFDYFQVSPEPLCLPAN